MTTTNRQEWIREAFDPRSIRTDCAACLRYQVPLLVSDYLLVAFIVSFFLGWPYAGYSSIANGAFLWLYGGRYEKHEVDVHGGEL